MQLNCPNCGEEIAASGVHLASQVAKCVACNAVFSFAHVVRRDAQERSAFAPVAGVTAPRPRPAVTLSWQLTFRQSEGVWEARFAWFHPLGLVATTIGALLWAACIVFWLNSGVRESFVGPLLGLLLLLHVGGALMLLLNVTRIRIEDNFLNVRRGPLWILGDCRLPVSRIAQLYCRDRGTSKRAPAYELTALLTNGKHVPLLRWFRTVDDLLYLEQVIEARLWIEDQAVPGESWS